MKKIFFVLASVLVSMGMQAQTVHVYNNDGSVDTYSNDEVDYVVFNAPATAGTADTQPKQLWEGGPEWARWDLGASAEGKIGAYYQWGEVKGYTDPWDEKNYWWKKHDDTYCDAGGDYIWWDRDAWNASTPSDLKTEERILWRFINKYQIDDHTYSILDQFCTKHGIDFSTLTAPMWYNATGKFTPQYVLVDDRDKTDKSKAFGLDGNYLGNGIYRVVKVEDAAGRYSRPARFLDPSNDAAFMGLNPSKKYEDKGTWRMPTFKELKKLCELSYKTGKYEVVSGVPGIRIYGEPGTKYEKNSIFLPAAGYRLNHDLLERNVCGYFWSSDLSDSFTYYGKFQGFVYGSDEIVNTCFYGDRFLGYNIRPVRNAGSIVDPDYENYYLYNPVPTYYIDRDEWMIYNEADDDWVTQP